MKFTNVSKLVPSILIIFASSAFGATVSGTICIDNAIQAGGPGTPITGLVAHKVSGHGGWKLLNAFANTTDVTAQMHAVGNPVNAAVNVIIGTVIKLDHQCHLHPTITRGGEIGPNPLGNPNVVLVSSTVSFTNVNLSGFTDIGMGLLYGNTPGEIYDALVASAPGNCSHFIVQCPQNKSDQND